MAEQPKDLTLSIYLNQEKWEILLEIVGDKCTEIHKDLTIAKRLEKLKTVLNKPEDDSLERLSNTIKEGESILKILENILVDLIELKEEFMAEKPKEKVILMPNWNPTANDGGNT